MSGALRLAALENICTSKDTTGPEQEPPWWWNRFPRGRPLARASRPVSGSWFQTAPRNTELLCSSRLKLSDSHLQGNFRAGRVRRSRVLFLIGSESELRRVPAHGSRRLRAVCLQNVTEARQREADTLHSSAIPQSTKTSLNSSKPDGGARAHPVVLAALPAPAARSGSFVSMVTGKQLDSGPPGIQQKAERRGVQLDIGG